MAKEKGKDIKKEKDKGKVKPARPKKDELSDVDLEEVAGGRMKLGGCLDPPETDH